MEKLNAQEVELNVNDDLLDTVLQEEEKGNKAVEKEEELIDYNRVRAYELEELVIMKRNRSVGKGLVTQVSEKLFPTKRGSERIPVLTLQIGKHTTAYCPIDEAGIRVPRNPQWLVGREKPFVIEHFQKTEEGNIAIVSIKAGELALSKSLYDEVTTAKAKQVYPAHVVGVNEDRRYVLIELKGVQAIVPFDKWSYSYTTAASISIGELVEIIIDRAVEREDSYLFVGNKRALEQDPMEKLSSIQKRKDRFIGKIQQVDPIAGIFVEVAPGIVFKGLKGRGVTDPTVLDAEHKTLVTCELLSIDKKNKRGTVRIINYPQGQKKTLEIFRY
ncbi:RNA-binding protein [Bacillus sp. CGMCC 1.60114]|uniref:RNA-binding protein n=1 Tax=unclassified Bacillus (in: firmicutes) TaxID=185979 RepID=UPI00363BDDBD